MNTELGVGWLQGDPLGGSAGKTNLFVVQPTRLRETVLQVCSQWEGVMMS